MAHSDNSTNYLLQLILEKLETLQNLLYKRNKPFLTVQEASEYLGISDNTLYRYTSEKIVPFYKLRDRKIYFKISDLNRFVLSKKNKIETIYEIEE